MRRIYLDHAATTPTAPEVRAAMIDCLDRVHGNPSSQHSFGREAVAVLDEARDTVAEAFGTEAAQVCFTSSGTEAANLAVLGRALADDRKRIVFSSIEHSCVREAAELARELGIDAVPLAATPTGVVDPGEVERTLIEPASVVCVMHVNNEIGTILPIDEIREICRERDTPFFTDAVQSFGVLHLDATAADLISISGHKVYGPKGVGALIYRPGVRTRSLMVGGGQERERRAGTENLAGIAGLAAASRLATGSAARFAEHLQRVRDAFERRVLSLVDGVSVTGKGAPRHPGISHLVIDRLSAESVLIALDRAGVAASSGAACSSGAVERSHVLLAMGMSHDEAAAGLRFSFGRSTILEEAEGAADALAGVVARLRATRLSS